jgi:hypothetical protein
MTAPSSAASGPAPSTTAHVFRRSAASGSAPGAAAPAFRGSADLGTVSGTAAHVFRAFATSRPEPFPFSSARSAGRSVASWGAGA